MAVYRLASLWLLLCPSLFILAPTNGSSIPLIDISAWTRKDAMVDLILRQQQLQFQVADDVGRACHDIGFFAISGHGVNETVIQRTWDSVRHFFDLPVEDKLAFKTDNEREYPYGYEHSERLRQGKALDQPQGTTDVLAPADLKETFSVGPSNPLSGMPPRRLPRDPPELAEALELYYTEMERLASTLLEIFASALGLNRSWFLDRMDRHLSALRALNYFPVDPAVRLPGAMRASQHTDYGILTILKSGGPGLQVKKDLNSSFEWVDVPSYKGNVFIINIGDLMQRWTNDRWISTLHRVILPSENSVVERRQSLAFFVNLNGDAVVEALPTCIDGEHPPKYPPVMARDHVMAKHLASMGYNTQQGDSSDAGSTKSDKDEL